MKNISFPNLLLITQAASFQLALLERCKDITTSFSLDENGELYQECCEAVIHTNRLINKVLESKNDE